MAQIKTNRTKGNKQAQPLVIQLVPRVHSGTSRKRAIPANCSVVPMKILRKPERIVRRKPKRRK